MINRIVVGSDGSEQANHAVAFAAELARQTSAEVVLVHVVGQFPTALGAGGYMMYVPQEIIDEPLDDLERRVCTEYAKPLIAAGVSWRAEVREGWAPRALASVADELNAQLIVVGSRGLHALGEFFLGSTSHALTHYTRVPLIVVPSSATHEAVHAAKTARAAKPAAAAV